MSKIIVNDPIDGCCEGELSFKSTKELYGYLFRKTDGIMRKYNPCNVLKGKCVGGEFCCSGCEYNGNTGCTVESLACKLWLCDKVIPKIPKQDMQNLRSISLIAMEYRLLIARGSYDDLMSRTQKPLCGWKLPFGAIITIPIVRKNM
jgi:hypothetical protein